MKTLQFRRIALLAVSLCTVSLYATACSRDESSSSTSAETTTESAAPSASVPDVMIPDTFTASGANRTYDARRAFDFTGDGIPETIALHAAGASIDKAAVTLAILGTSGDTLYSSSWNT